MIVLTVKTLDSQNHTFSVDDDITVEQFKAKIADTVNISAETQRIIYCGRVLQDSSKLNEYDVNGKVVHLVQRAPPSQNPPTTRSASPQPPRRGFRGFETANTMYLGSMAFPSNLMESQGIVPPPPTHSLAGSRLNVAKRMLRRAENVINLLENPTTRPAEQPNNEDQTEEEVTPIIEAQVIVPRGENETIDEAMVISAVQNTIFDAASGAIPMGGVVTVETSTTTVQTSETPPETSSTASTPEEGTASNNASENPIGEQRNGGVNARSLAENASRTTEMADLLTTLNLLQSRFAPFLERYRQFMVDDPVIPQEEIRQTQTMLARVSEVLHFLGHAYHSLSDIIIRVRTPPPRPLLCRPILIQHSAVVQAGIPIQVEAQFNLSQRSNGPTANTTTNSESATTTTPPQSTTSATATTTNATSAGTGNAQAQTNPTVNVRRFPFLPSGGSMRVQSFPIEVRAGGRTVNLAGSRPQNNNNNTVGGAAANTSTNTAGNENNRATEAPPSGATNSGSGAAGNPFNIPNFNNSSLEFFMEVSPDGGSMNGPPPEFLQSIVQMAGQLMSRVATSNGAPPTSTPPSTTADTTNATTTSGAEAATNGAGQNSQARVTTATHPTTSTHTRSTPRPHVHIAQQAMQGGFDPFLPCNSHHVTHRRRATVTGQANLGRHQQQQQQPNNAAQQAQAQPAAASQEGGAPEAQNLQNVLEEVYGMLNRTMREGGWQGGQQAGSTDDANTGTSAEGQRTGPMGFSLPNIGEIFSNATLPSSTLADILRQDDDEDEESRAPGNLVSEFMIMLSRNLTLVDMMAINRANYAPLNRIRGDIREFLLQHLVEPPIGRNVTTVSAGVNRLVTEMQPFFERFGRLRVRGNVNLVRSMESLFRQRLPDIFVTIANMDTDEEMQQLIEQCIELFKTMFGIAVHVSANGRQGVEEMFSSIITNYMQGAPDDIINWTIATSRVTLRQFLEGITITTSAIEPFLIRNEEDAMETVSPEQQSEGPRERCESEQPMELDEPVAVAGAASFQNCSSSGLSDDQEPLPTVVVGSEAWHGSVPEDWVPIISRDVQRQRRQSTQTPFSDAYLSGMPTKRRKIVNTTKPQGSLPQVIAESVRRAVTTTGLAPAAPIELVSQGAGDSSEIQTAYRSLLRSTVQSALRDNEDFTPERFPNASTYFKPQ